MMKQNVKAKLEILEQLENKTITAEEAEKRLEALKQEPAVKDSSKIFKIDVASSDGDKVNIQVPITFARALLRGSKRFGSTKLADVQVDIEDVLDMVDEGHIGELVNVESADGDIVKIYIDSR